MTNMFLSLQLVDFTLNCNTKIEVDDLLYVMWAELGHSHFASEKCKITLEMGTKNVFNGTVRFCFCLTSSVLTTALLL